MTTLFFILGGLLSIVATIKGVFTARRVIARGEVGIIYRLGNPIYERIEVSPGVFESRLKIYGSGIVWKVPLINRLETLKPYEVNTSEALTITVQRPGGKTSLVKAVMTYNVSEAVGVGMALIMCPDYHGQVTSFFADVLSDVFAVTDQTVGRAELRELVLERARSNPNLIAYGAEPIRVALPDVSDTWPTQLADQMDLRKVLPTLTDPAGGEVFDFHKHTPAASA